MPITAQTRITGGEWRGRLLSTPREQLLRPTRSMVREALFNMVGDAVAGAAVVDLYAGAGTVGFEALSRGAAGATFVDNDGRALAHVRASAERFACADRCFVVGADALRWVRSSPAALREASIVFLDAPYHDDAVEDVLHVLGQAPPPFVVCEHHRARVVPERVGGLVVVRRARYGITDLSILRPSGQEVGEGE
jgi:16S rRNA (guanine966-N2)-methyltransferase